MALVLKDRVQETATANTTVSFTCTGAVTGFQAFSVIGNTNTTFYTGTDVSGNWESGIGTYTTAGTLVTRTTVLASSNAGSAVTFSGTVNLFVSYPATNSINLDASGNASPLGTIASGTWQGSTIGVAYGGTGVTTSTGSGDVVLSTSPTFVTPILGTPTSGTLTNCTFPTLNQNTSGTAAGLSTTLVVGSGGTGLTAVGTSGNVLTSNGTTWASTAPAASGISAGKAIAISLVFG